MSKEKAFVVSDIHGMYDEFMEKRIPVRFGVLCAYLQKCQEPESHPVDWENDEWKSGFVFDRVRL